MSQYKTAEDYREAVQNTAKKYFDWGEAGMEEIRSSAYNPEDHPEEGVPDWAIAYAAVEHHELVQYYGRFVIHHADNGFYNEGGAQFYNDPENQTESVRQLAHAGFFNDILTEVRHIRRTRTDLGKAVKMIEGPILGDGYELTYEYEEGIVDPEIREYTFECLSEGEFRVRDPDGIAFEVISPRVIVENRDDKIPEYALELFLDNMCAKRERERQRKTEA